MRRKLLIIFGVVSLPLLLVAGSFLFSYHRSFEFVSEHLSNSNSFFAKSKVALPDSEDAQKDFSILWYSDFDGNRVVGLSGEGKIVWEQGMDTAPIPKESYNVHTEYVTVAPNGNLIVADGDGMMVQEIDRTTHELLWQGGKRSVQGAIEGLLHQPDRSFKINDHEVLINDGNNRRVIIVDQNTNKIVWQYGHTLEMGPSPGYLRGNTSASPFNGGQQIIITDTLEKKFIIIDRATKQILWEYKKPDADWLQHVFATSEGTFVLEDRQKNEVFEIDGKGNILWTLNKLADGTTLKYPTDTIKLPNGYVLISDAGQDRIIEVVPGSGQIIRKWSAPGFATTIAIDYSPPPPGNQVIAGKPFIFVGPRQNIPAGAPSDYGFWSFAVPVTGVLSRSGQPTIADFKWLKEQGGKSVVDLRVDGERDEVGDDRKIEGFNELGFNYLALPIADGSPPTNEQAQKFLEFVTNPANQPVHVHCRGGYGRTGIMVALYRYSVQGWPWLTAIDESRLFQEGVSDSQKNWLERWAQDHVPGSLGR